MPPLKPRKPRVSDGGEARIGRGKVTSTATVKSGSMEAPVNAANDFLEDESADNMAAFFSSGTGPAMHYHQGDAAGVGQESQGEEAAEG